MQLSLCNFISVKLIEVSKLRFLFNIWSSFMCKLKISSRLKRKQTSGGTIPSGIQVREARQAAALQWTEHNQHFPRT